jgi:SAM-dependent methyltransferase
MGGSTERDARDKQLFDTVAVNYARKDQLPSAARARKLRLEQTVAQVPAPPWGRILEAGCGAGYAAHYLQGRYATYVGFDHSTELVTIAESLNGGPNRRFLVGDAKTITFEEKFHGLLMIGILHHIADPLDALKNLVRQLRYGAWVAANEPQGANPLIRGARAIRKRLAKDYSDEQDQYRAEELRALFLDAGLEDVRLIPQGLFSTPFAEVAMPMQRVADIASRAACRADKWLEGTAVGRLRNASWNLIAVGKRSTS